MVNDTIPCPHCQEPMPPWLGECPACGLPVPPPGPGARPSAPVPAASPAAVPAPRAQPPGAAVEEGLARFQRWREAGEGLGLEVPTVPAWALARARGGRPEGWAEFFDEEESELRGKVVGRLEQWERETLARIQRLEAYSIDGRLEREQVDDALVAARGGEASRAASVVQQVDRVISLKERHLALARQELDRLTELLRDLTALGIPTTYRPTETAEALEEELRRGRLAPLKQELRSLRLDIVRSLKTAFPEYVSRTGLALEKARLRGAEVEEEVHELARCAKAYADGRPDEAVRRLRLLSERSSEPPPARTRSGATGSSRTV